MAERLYEGQTFEGLRLEDEYLDHLRFVDCHFINCTFEGGVLTDCAFAACTWTGCKVINVTSRRTQIRSLSFEQCDLVGLTAADWLPASRFMAPLEHLTNCRLKYVTFQQMALAGFDFGGNEVVDGLFSGCDLSGAGFHSCSLLRTEFADCNLTKADFRGATGWQVDLPSCRMRGARFSFPEAVRLLASAGVQGEYE